MAQQPSTTKSWRLRVWQVAVAQSWWVWLFAMLCFLGLRIAQERQERSCTALKLQQEEMQQALAAAQSHEQRLRAQLDSQEDKAWMELVLKRRLGLVPKGQTKVLFQSEPARLCDR